MKAHKYWSLGALACMAGCFYTGCKKLMQAHKYFACGSLVCMGMAIYSGHKIAAKEFTLEDFSCEHLFDSANGEDTDCWTYSTEGICEIEPIDILNLTIAMLNKARELYLDYQQKASTGDQFAKDHVKEYWWQMIQLLPSSYNQRRTVMLNYEVLANIYKSRRNHKLDEWHTFCDWIEGLPYNELITGPSLKDIPISNEIMEEAKRRVHEELNAQFDHFCKLHEG